MTASQAAASAGSLISARDTAIAAALKLTEVAFRLLFLLEALIFLEPAPAGQFGLLNTLIALFALCAGFECWGVVWRKLAVIEPTAHDALIASVIRFFQFNYLLLSPAFIVAAVFWLQLTPYETGLGLAIAVGEQLAAESYRLAVVQGKYRRLLAISVGKNAAVLMAMSMLVFAFKSAVALTVILEIWATANLISLLGLRMVYHSGGATDRRAGLRTLSEIAQQYRESLAFFGTGFVAFCSVQIDRLVVGAVATLELTGIYFKNVFLAASIYTAATILLHNRAVPAIYRAVAQHRYDEAARTLRRESAKAVAGYAIVMLTLLATVRAITGDEFLARNSVSTTYLAGLLFAFCIRSAADYNCTFLNSTGHEKWVLRLHGLTVAVSVLLLFYLTKSFGVAGAVAAMTISFTTLWVTSAVFKRHLLGLLRNKREHFRAPPQS